MENLKISDDYETYKLGSFKLKSGGEIPDAFIAFQTFGDPSLPAIIYPSWYSGSTCLLTPSSMVRALTNIPQRHIRQSLVDRLGQDT
jgi:homoserine acetyltransferase